jgi:hypothetical protein
MLLKYYTLKNNNGTTTPSSFRPISRARGEQVGVVHYSIGAKAQ